MVDEERVADLLMQAETYVHEVRAFADEVGREGFLADRGEQYRIEFPLQQAIQRTIDVAAHLLADAPGRRPATLAAIFDELADRGDVPADHADRLASMARFRNLLVHQYADVVPELVWQIISENLVDIEEFLAIVARRLG